MTNLITKEVRKFIERKKATAIWMKESGRC